MAELRRYWDGLLATYTASTGDERVDRMVNIWNPYQCMVTFNMSRSASYFESGIGRGMGFRDSNQDLLGFVHLVPDRARERILDTAATQFPDGSAYHQYQPLTKRGNTDVGTGFNDDPLWLIEGVAAYIKETGDFTILDEEVPFDNNPDDTGTLFEHLRRSFHHVLHNRGPHGLPLIGRADWNDCLNLNCFSETPGESFQTTENRAGGTAESVFIAGLFVHCAPDYADLAEAVGEPAEAESARAAAAAMSAVVLDHGWDGDWFVRAYDFFGNKVGSARVRRRARSTSNRRASASWPASAWTPARPPAPSIRCRRSWTPTTGSWCCSLPTPRYYLELGEISTYPPGYKENAGIFCHNNPWVVIAETKLGRGDRAFEYLEDRSPRRSGRRSRRCTAPSRTCTRR